MKRLTHGKCERCRILWRWSGRPLLRDALCERCKHPLARTAAALARRWLVMDGDPFETKKAEGK